MPPKAKITREMILDAAFALVRKEGIECLNARAVAGALGCSTQPVLYHFARVEDIKKAAYEKADEFHTAYITDIRPEGGNPLRQIGLNYIRFAAEEKNLFRFLFQSDGFSGRSLPELVGDPALEPVLSVLRETAGMSEAQTKKIFLSVFLAVHGYASLFANNDMVYDERAVAGDLDRAFQGAVYAYREEEK